MYFHIQPCTHTKGELYLCLYSCCCTCTLSLELVNISVKKRGYLGSLLTCMCRLLLRGLFRTVLTSVVPLVSAALIGVSSPHQQKLPLAVLLSQYSWPNMGAKQNKEYCYFLIAKNKRKPKFISSNACEFLCQLYFLI